MCLTSLVPTVLRGNPYGGFGLAVVVILTAVCIPTRERGNERVCAGGDVLISLVPTVLRGNPYGGFGLAVVVILSTVCIPTRERGNERGWAGWADYDVSDFSDSHGPPWESIRWFRISRGGDSEHGMHSHAGAWEREGLG